MKTPREVLLERHRSAEAGLDAVRQNALTAAVDVSRHGRPAITPLFVILKLWQELIWPCRRIWLGMAALWLGILTLNLMTNGTSPVATNETSRSNPEVFAAWKEQRKLMAQLLDPGATPPMVEERRSGPRTDRRQILLLG
jgi:hypothetical protein